MSSGRPIAYKRDNSLLTDNMRRLLIETAAAYDVPAFKMAGHNKTKEIVPARAEWFHRMLADGYTYGEIGYRTGFDHTSVMYLVRRHSRLQYGTCTRATKSEILETHFEAIRPLRAKLEEAA